MADGGAKGAQPGRGVCVCVSRPTHRPEAKGAPILHRVPEGLPGFLTEPVALGYLPPSQGRAAPPPQCQNSCDCIPKQVAAQQSQFSAAAT